MITSARIRGAVALALALLFGLGFGLNYGSSTQVSYILRSVKILHPTLWTRDWLVSQTHVYHPAYAWFGTLLLRLTPSGSAVAWANVLFIAIGMLALYVTLGALVNRERVLLAFCVVLILASVTRTLAPGGSYAFSELFLPSTLGTVGTLAAAAAFILGRPLLAGLCLAFAGLFHVNYLVLDGCVFGAAWLFGGRERRLLDAVVCLGPACLVLLWDLPFLLISASPSVSAEAQRIFQDVRSPHHYCVPNFAWDFLLWAGFQGLGAAALLGPARRGSLVHRRMLQLLAGWWALVFPAALLSSVVVVNFVRQLFAWRICAEADLLAQAALAAALVGVFCEGRRALPTLDRPTRWLFGLSLAALVLGSIMAHKVAPMLVVLILIGVAVVIEKGYLRSLTTAPDSGLSAGRVLAALLITLAAVNVARFSRLARYSNLLSGGDRGAAELCTWVTANTPEDALLLTPPDEEELRFRCRRAIVVDWKTAPVEPAEVLAWFERIEDVTGRRPFHNEADLTGYNQLDAARLARLQARYGIDYLVVERGHEPDLGVAPAFSGQRLVVYRLPGAKRAGML
jgi:hypothetical protein